MLMTPWKGSVPGENPVPPSRHGQGWEGATFMLDFNVIEETCKEATFLELTLHPRADSPWKCLVMPLS